MKIKDWILEREDGKEVEIGEKLIDFRYNENYKLIGGTPPYKLSSTGKVYVLEEENDLTSTYYPGVFKLHWRNLNAD